MDLSTLRSAEAAICNANTSYCIFEKSDCDIMEWRAQ
jgi:hypothetical protein